MTPTIPEGTRGHVVGPGYRVTAEVVEVSAASVYVRWPSDADVERVALAMLLALELTPPADPISWWQMMPAVERNWAMIQARAAIRALVGEAAE